MIPNNYTDFQYALEESKPDHSWPEGLQALWYVAKDDWQKSHAIAQDLHTPLGNWIHAYLHRKEGDEFNAGFWYRQAGKTYPIISLEDELQEIVESTL
ncbi:hypothetical protein I2486_20960 [Cellulophaga sp. E16_2]|uniref:Uncharacterized protein n=1 Tax=Cellulophaga algicola (strain DSM 14237 / IC166 / ACAM 630) TaxID=688270 RepID=E6X4D1_CELAD|nr:MULTISPECIES: hypothetical protein [Cellulophaga]ADV51514.1 hypothetical protein Celal_4274 [Cellulophaga algicola DSM 14237]MBO0593881.1 hypothetical protein [Cellulophaga sp. E16_2]